MLSFTEGDVCVEGVYRERYVESVHLFFRINVLPHRPLTDGFLCLTQYEDVPRLLVVVPTQR